MWISKNYTIDHWKALTFSNEADWKEAINIFRDRVETRFLEFIRLIERHEHSGFVIVALDCLLIETLQQFYEGVRETPEGKSKDYFVEFLTKTSFGKFFDKSLATMFYKRIRNGILHQAEIKGSSRIRIGEKVPLVKLSKDGNGLIINRKLFHNQLVEECKNYVSRLRENSPPDMDLRNKFRKKMDYICNPI